MDENKAPAKITEADVIEQLRRIVDPEVHINIVDLGLIYDIAIDGGHVHVVMTLTTPGCPLHNAFDRAVRQVLHNIPGVTNATVDLVFDPPWSPERISEDIRKELWGDA